MAENRRRRIVDRGSDRLAFITGQTRSLPPAAAELEASPPSVAPHYEHGVSVVKPYDEQTVKEHTGGSSSNTENERSHGILHHEKVDGLILSDEKGKETEVKLHQSNKEPMLASESVSGRPSEPQVAMADVINLPEVKQGIFSAKRISHSISASENTRLLFVVIMSLFVVLSNKGYLGSQVARKLVNVRPLLLVLLADLTIVFGKLMTTKVSGEENKRKTKAKKEEQASTDNIGKTLDIGLVIQKATRAFFMDCSISALIFVSAL